MRILLLPLTAGVADASPELVICPFAGASSGAFHSWRALRTAFTARLVLYPGREQLINEPYVPTISALAGCLASTLAGAPAHGPWILLGHSMGAQVAFETCRLLEARGRAPSGLVLSAAQAPHLSPRRRLSQLDDDDFLQELIEIGGCPDALMRDAALRELYLPLLRADFQASEAYWRPLDVGGSLPETPTLLLYGESDPEASREDISAWQHWLRGTARVAGIAGDHFFFTSKPEAVLAALRRAF